MKLFFRFSLLVLLMLLSAASAHADPDQKRAESSCEKVDITHLSFTNWHDLYRSYSEFKQCDDSAIAEGYSDAVVQLLANHWDTLSDFISLSNSDTSFRQFVYRHIDATTSEGDLTKIIESANSKCPSADKDICQIVNHQAVAAKADIEKTISSGH